MTEKIYLKEVLAQIPRLLSHLDRNPFSKTCGCFDRDYWHNKLIDFPCARKQEAVLTLAILYNSKSRINPYFNNENILQWINAALNFWSDIQEKNGSFSEWYPNENSFVATAFSSYAVSETLLILNKKKIKNKEKILSSLRKANNWLINKKEKRAFNQTCGAALSLLNMYLLSKENKYQIAAKKKATLLIRNQKKEGWWEEYKGADIGYLSLAIDYLAKFYKKTKDPAILHALTKAISFIKYFISPDLTFGGEYCSRNTEYLIPHGFEILSKTNKDAASIANQIRKSIKNKTSISPFSLDDRYLLYIGYTWLQAYTDSKKLRKTNLQSRASFEKNFPNCKIYIRSDPNLHLILNYGKSAFKLYLKKSNKAIHDSGLLVENKIGKFTSSWINNKYRSEIGKNRIKVKGNMLKQKEILLSPKKNISLRIFQETIGKHEKIGRFIKERLRDSLITKNRVSRTSFEREFIISKDNIKIIDSVSSDNNIQKIIVGAKFSDIYTPSSRYFQTSELKNKTFVLENISSKKIKVIRDYSYGRKLKQEIQSIKY